MGIYNELDRMTNEELQEYYSENGNYTFSETERKNLVSLLRTLKTLINSILSTIEKK